MAQFDNKLIAFYLPQFHPIKENNEWWGEGFTEWTNVSRAKPIYPGHYQPHLPADLGFCDLRVPEVRVAQAAMAEEYGIHGFCYYHYWFNGRRILERPFDEMLSSGTPDFPFCLCWANENWTRTWDGGDHHTLLQQNYSAEDDYNHIRWLLPALGDKRYIRHQDKPLLLIYRAERLPNVKKTLEIWRDEALLQGIGELYIACVENFVGGEDPRIHGFDGAVEFAPDWQQIGADYCDSLAVRTAANMGILPKALLDQHLYSYDQLAKNMMAKPSPDYPLFRGISLGWDNSARKRRGAKLFVGSTPDKYEQWLVSIIAQSQRSSMNENPPIFINAWNEWAEGTHLEPDQRWGRGYLEATRRALQHPDKPRDFLDSKPPLWVADRYIKYLYDRFIGWR